MVFLPAATASDIALSDVRATESASTDNADAIVGRFRRMMGNIRYLLT
jgi:hypothetical protein